MQFAPCVTPYGPLTVNRFGGYRINNEPENYGSFDTKIPILKLDGTTADVTLANVLLTTFVGGPGPNTVRVHRAVVNTESPHYRPGRVHVNQLKWSLPNGTKYILKDPEPVSGEVWKLHKELDVWISSENNRFQRKGVDACAKRISFETGTKGAYVYIRNKGKRRAYHRLVAEAFLGPNPEGKNMVDHLDGDITNNNPLNLRWCSASENNSNRARVPNPCAEEEDELMHFPDCECEECINTMVEIQFVPAFCFAKI
jgi:hypothetical protein